MSLGPPFDSSGMRVQLGAGATTVVITVAAVGIALLASDRSLGESLVVRVQMRTPGALRTGAPVRMAGMHVGEVVAIRGVGWPRAGKGLVKEAGVEVELRLLRAYQRFIYRNSTFFAHSDNVLTDAIIEIGPPRHGAAPDRPIEDGETVRGEDPPDMGHFLLKVHHSLTTLLEGARDLSPDWELFRESMTRLQATLDEVIEPPAVARVALRGGRALSAAGHLLEALQQAEAPARIRHLAVETGRALDEIGPQVQHIGRQLGRLEEQLRDVTTAFGPQQRRQLEEAVARFRRAMAAAEQLSADVRWLQTQLERGRGTVGGFRQDLQIFDELKEIHRILKHEGWRLLFKQTDPSQRLPR
ncbi:MAG: MlaD family protein [Myxococcota bacterium]|nr:MlaD family protein [Myxococcota bacterium]